MTKTNIPGRRKQPAAFRRTFKDYTTESILRDESHWSEKDLRKAYSELRSVARKRLIRLKEAGFEESALFQNNATKFKPLDDVKDRSELEDLVSDVAKFVRQNLTKASEMRPWIEKNIKTIEKSTTVVDKKTGDVVKPGVKMSVDDFLKYDRFMKEWHKKKNLTDLDSDRVGDFLEQYMDKINLTNWDIILNDFKNWKNKQIKTEKQFNDMLKRSKNRIKKKMTKK